MQPEEQDTEQMPETPTSQQQHDEFGGQPAIVRSASSKSFLAMRAAMNVLGKNTTRGWLAEKVWLTIEPEAGSKSRNWFICVWPLVIMAGVAVALIAEIMAESLNSLHFFLLEFVFDCLFTLELLVRFAVCPDRHAFFVDMFNIVDVAAGLLPLITRLALLALSGHGSEADVGLALTCITPGLRLLKLLRRFEKFHLLLNAFYVALEALPVLLFTLVLIVVVFSAGIYWVEPRDNIQSFPRAMWLTVVTMTTVGYGDTVPKSVAGYVIVSVLVIFSALYMAIPIGIVGNAFNRVWEDRDRLLLLHRIRLHLGQKGYDAVDIPELFFLFDQDSDGQLSFAEFCQMMCGLKLGLNEDRMVRLFHAFDNNGSGGVDDVEFVRRLFPQAYCQVYGPTPIHVDTPPSQRTTARRPAVTNVGAFRQTLSGQNNSERETATAVECDTPASHASCGDNKPLSL